jgi:hypothetical protein
LFRVYPPTPLPKTAADALTTWAAEAGCSRPDTLLSSTTFGLVHAGPLAHTGTMPGKKKATDELVTAVVDPVDVVAEVG